MTATTLKFLSDSWRKSPWHPFGILFLTISLLVLYTSLASAAGQLIFLLILPAVFLLFGAPPKKILGHIRVFLWMLPLTFLMHAFLASEGIQFFTQLFQGSLQPALLYDAFSFTLRLFVFIYIMGGLFTVIQLQRILDALAAALQPLRRLGLPVTSLFQVLNIGLRFFPVLREESLRLQEVRRSLGIGSDETIRGRIQTQVNSVVPIFINAMHRAEIVAQMMTLRGYSSGNRRTLYATVEWRLKDSLLTAVCLFSIAGVAVI